MYGSTEVCLCVCEYVYFSTLKPSHLYLIRTQYSYCEIVGRSVFHSMPFDVILDFFFLWCIAQRLSDLLCVMLLMYVYSLSISTEFFFFLCWGFFVILLHFSCSMCAPFPTKYKRFVCSVYYVLWSMVILQFYPVYWLTGPTVVHLVLVSISIDTTM